jgi:hypothetical protein
MILGVTGEVRSLQNHGLGAVPPKHRRAVRRAVRKVIARRHPVLAHVVLQGMHTPVYLPMAGYAPMGEMGSWLSKTLKKVSIKTAVKPLINSADWAKKHERELVAVGSTILGGALIATGVGAPLGLAVAGAGIGSTLGPHKGSTWGKPLEYGTPMLIGGAAGYGAGWLLPEMGGTSMFTGNAINYGGAGGAQWIGGGISSMFSPSAAIPTAGTGMEIAPAAGSSMEIAPAAGVAKTAAAATGGSWWEGILGGAAKILAPLAVSKVLGAGSGGAAGAAGAAAQPGQGSNISVNAGTPGATGASGTSASGGSSGDWGSAAGPTGEASVVGDLKVNAAVAAKTIPYVAIGVGVVAIMALAYWGATRRKRTE